MTGSPYSKRRLRQAGLYFVAGRAVSAGLTLVVFAMIARSLPIKDYGTYSVGLALVEIGIGLSLFGIDSIISRLLPEYRVSASGAMLARTVCGLSGMLAASFAVGSAIAFASADLIARAADLADAGQVVRLFSAVLFFEGLSRIARDQILSAALLQGVSQIAQLTRMTTMLVLLWLSGQPSLVQVVTFELVASGLSAFVGWSGVAAFLWRQRGQTASTDWLPAPLRQMVNLASYSYANSVLWLAYSPSVITIILSRFAGAESAAVFGFARGLSEQIRRYLPAEFFIGMIRPALVARYVQEQDFGALMNRIELILKASLLALMPLLVFFLVAGTALCSYLSHGRLAGAAPVLWLLLLQHVPGSNRRFVDVVGAIVHRADICVRAAVPLLLTPVLAAALLAGVPSAGAVGVVALLVIAELFYSLVASNYFRRAGFAYRMPSAATMLRLLAYATGASLALFMLPIERIRPDLLQLGLSGALAVVLVSLLAYAWPPFSRAEVAQMKELVFARKS